MESGKVRFIPHYLFDSNLIKVCALYSFLTLVQDWQTKSVKIHLKLGQSLFIVSKSSQGIVFLGKLLSHRGKTNFLVWRFLSYGYRFPSYVGEAVDKTVPKDAEIPEHRKTVTTEEAWLLFGAGYMIPELKLLSRWSSWMFILLILNVIFLFVF